MRKLATLTAVAALTVTLGLAGAAPAAAEPISVKVNAFNQDGDHLKVKVEGASLHSLTGTARLKNAFFGELEDFTIVDSEVVQSGANTYIALCSTTTTITYPCAFEFPIIRLWLERSGHPALQWIGPSGVTLAGFNDHNHNLDAELVTRITFP